jgi:hypothetical protein
MIRPASLALLMLAAPLAAPASADPPAASPIRFDAHRLGAVRSEALCVADIDGDGDGRKDVVAGPFVYLAPSWRPLKVRALSGEVGPDGSARA